MPAFFFVHGPNNSAFMIMVGIFMLVTMFLSVFQHVVEDSDSSLSSSVTQNRFANLQRIQGHYLIHGDYTQRNNFEQQSNLQGKEEDSVYNTISKRLYSSFLSKFIKQKETQPPTKSVQEEQTRRLQQEQQTNETTTPTNTTSTPNTTTSTIQPPFVKQQTSNHNDQQQEFTLFQKYNFAQKYEEARAKQHPCWYHLSSSTTSTRTNKLQTRGEEQQLYLTVVFPRLFSNNTSLPWFSLVQIFTLNYSLQREATNIQSLSTICSLNIWHTVFKR